MPSPRCVASQTDPMPPSPICRIRRNRLAIVIPSPSRGGGVERRLTVSFTATSDSPSRPREEKEPQLHYREHPQVAHTYIGVKHPTLERANFQLHETQPVFNALSIRISSCKKGSSQSQRLLSALPHGHCPHVLGTIFVNGTPDFFRCAHEETSFSFLLTSWGTSRLHWRWRAPSWKEAGFSRLTATLRSTRST